ncbi:MAG: hypothetical protein IPP68_07850 [Elusimicrobia bacterium]|nr:hypothetical protein [Elusimicrobiota bacterium]
MTVLRKFHRETAAALGCLALVFAVYGRGLFYSFVYDDRWTVVENNAVQQPTPLARFFLDRNTVAAPATGMGDSIYRPLPTLTFALDRALGARDPWRFRLENVLLHALNGFLLWLLFRSVGFSFGASLAGSAAFLLHPAQVETVQWVTQRSNLLCLGGLLGSVWALRRRSPWSLVGLAVALLSKETAVMALCLWPLFLRVYCPEEKFWESGPARVRVLAGATLVAAYLFLRSAVVGSFAQREFRGGGWGGSVLLGTVSWWEYLKLLLAPLGLRVSRRQYLDNPWTSPWALVGLAAVALAAVGLVFLWRRNRRAAFWAGWIPATLLPVLGLAPTDTFVAERFLYVPLVGLGGVAAIFWDRISSEGARARRWVRGGTWGVLALWGGLSCAQVGVWRNDLSLWTATAARDPEHGFSWLCRAQALNENKRWSEAESEYLHALRVGLSRGHAAGALTNLSDLRLRAGDPGGALAWADKALVAAPASPQALTHRAVALVGLGRKNEALAVVGQLESIRPGADEGRRLRRWVESAPRFRRGS